MFATDVDMVRWLEASGYDVTYVSDTDVATEPALLKSHRVLLMMGHPEYWTWNERNDVEDALAHGVNLVFASGNDVYWNVRLESSSLGSSRIITCYKDARLDPLPDRPFATVLFADPPLNRPENSLIGIRYAGSSSIDSSGPHDYPWVMSGTPDRWYFDCTGLQPGDQVNNIVGPEWDSVQNNGHTPPGIEVLSTSHVQNRYGAPSVANSTIYTSTNGAKVFAAGTIHWSYGLIDHTFNNNRFYDVQSQAADPRIEQLMANILDNFAGYWDGRPRGCGTGNQDFYDVGDRATRTPKPEVPTATAISHARLAPTVPGLPSAAGTVLPKATRPLATTTPVS